MVLSYPGTRIRCPLGQSSYSTSRSEMADCRVQHQLISRVERLMMPRSWSWQNDSITALALGSSRVKNSRDQSSDDPVRRSWFRIVPPYFCFHSQTFLTNSSRPMSWRLDPALRQLLLNLNLGGNPSVVRTRNPQNVVPLHPPPPGDRILDGTGESMAKMEDPCDVRRGEAANELLVLLPRVVVPPLLEVGTGTEEPTLLPPVVPPLLDLPRVV
eukprot:Sspe_Gene.8948::Locus_3009_Transcript_1_1_Confidence_1.000_Length_3269::g.8948::m.8948